MFFIVKTCYNISTMKRCVNLVFSCLFLTILSVILLLTIDRNKNHVDSRVKKNNVTKISQERQKID